MKNGSLVCVGSGITSIGHLTLEAQGRIKHADMVVYCVADPATEIWIKQHARRSFDLYTLYGNDKRRINTYNEMVSVMVDNVCAGSNVCAVFYGHPGVFVLPTHKAIKVLREEGYTATMLPGVSALDCLFADVGVDPSMNGCQTVEATDLLLRQRPLLTDGHVVIWQIGCVGDLGFRFAGYDNRNFGLLIKYLLKFYKPHQEVVHYTASQFPVCEPIIERMSLEQLLEADITGISTLYIPPADERPAVPEVAWKMGLRLKGCPPPSKSLASSSVCGEDKTPPKYMRKVPLKSYQPSRDQSGLADYIADLAQDPALLAEFKANPKIAARTDANLTEEEYRALISRHPGRIRIVLKEPPEYLHLANLDDLFGDAYVDPNPCPEPPNLYSDMSLARKALSKLAMTI